MSMRRTLSSLSTLSVQRLSKSFNLQILNVQDLLGLAEKSKASDFQHDVEETGISSITPMTATRIPSSSLRILSSNTPAVMHFVCRRNDASDRLNV